MSVTKELVNWINNPQEFQDYKRPDQSIEGELDDSVREHMVKNHALASIIYEN